MTAYYNENDPYCAQWLRNLVAEGLIAKGVVDERSIVDVRPSDLDGFTQCHFFAGLGGWSAALRMAGWPDRWPVWTGSCPCQPFSTAGKREGFKDARHLWPNWFSLIRERRPAIVFGEQVARAAEWLALVRGDLEEVGYAVGAMPIEAASVGANHIRDRFWFVAYSGSTKLRHEPGRSGRANGSGAAFARDNGPQEFVADAECNITTSGRPSEQPAKGYGTQATGTSVEFGRRGVYLADADTPGLPERGESQLLVQRPAAFGSGWWDIEPDVGRVAHGIPARVAKLRALGNAIVPQVAEQFIRATVDVLNV